MRYFYLKNRILRIKTMRTLTTTQFFQSLVEAQNGRIPTLDEMQQYFEDFTDTVKNICDQNPDKSIFRILNYAHVRLNLFQKLIAKDNFPEYIEIFAHFAAKILETERKLLYYRIHYPDCFVHDPNSISSPLYWSRRYPAIYLSELLSGLDILETHPIVLANGEKAPFTLVIETFEKVFHVKLGDPSEIKRSILQRKKSRTKFIDIIHWALSAYNDSKKP